MPTIETICERISCSLVLHNLGGSSGRKSAIIRKEATMIHSLRAFFLGAASEKKEDSVFSSEKEAYDFCLNLYKETGGVTPELRRAYEQYQSALHDDCPPESRPSGSYVEVHRV